MKSHLFSPHERGQSLIILVLMIALVVTVVTASSYRLTIETESAKLQEESVRALAAADAGIEEGLKRANTVGSAPIVSFQAAGITNAELPGIDLARSRILITETSTTEFASPVISTDEEYTYYFKDYPDFTGTDFTADINFYFDENPPANLASACSSPRSMPALELTFFYGANTIKRWVIEPCTSGITITGTGDIKTPNLGIATVDGTVFNRGITITAGSAGDDLNVMANHKILVIRSLFGATRIGIQTTPPQLPPQGKEIQSEAYSTTGPSKIVTVFQSLPQIPSDFFVTTF